MKRIVLTTTFFVATFTLLAQNSPMVASLKTEAIKDIDQKYEEYKKTALEIWNYAEVGIYI